DRAGLGVGLRPERRRAAAEHLGRGAELDMGLESDDGLVGGEDPLEVDEGVAAHGVVSFLGASPGRPVVGAERPASSAPTPVSTPSTMKTAKTGRSVTIHMTTPTTTTNAVRPHAALSAPFMPHLRPTGPWRRCGRARRAAGGRGARPAPPPGGAPRGGSGGGADRG